MFLCHVFESIIEAVFFLSVSVSLFLCLCVSLSVFLSVCFFPFLSLYTHTHTNIQTQKHIHRYTLTKFVHSFFGPRGKNTWVEFGSEIGLLRSFSTYLFVPRYVLYNSFIYVLFRNVHLIYEMLS